MRITRRLVISVAVSVAALTASAAPALASTSSGHSALATSTPQIAGSDFTGIICREPGNTACADLKDGTVKTNQPIFLWNNAQSNNLWYFVQEGTVSNSNASPFTPGSGLNYQFNGDPIYQVEYAGNHSYCMGVDSGGGGSVELEPCSSGNYWVFPEAAGPQSTLVNVYESNYIYQKIDGGPNNPQYLDNNTTTNGSSLFTDPEVEYWWGFSSN